MALLNRFFAPPADNATATLQELVRALGARVTKNTVQETLLSHPDFPSLLSLSDALTNWQIDNTALQLNTVEQLRELPLPFVAHLKPKGGWYVLVTALRGDTITYTDSEQGRVTKPLANFEKQWSGIVLLAECSDTSEQLGELDYTTKHKQERLSNLRGPFIVAGTLLALLVVIGSVAKDLNAPDWLLLLTKTIGLSLSGLLLAKQLGSKNALTDRLCSIGSQTNCDDVLNSPAAKLWGWLSWADVGLLYFAGGLITILLVGNVPGLWPLVQILTLLALPYTMFSIYYQARVIRQWCTLCLLVQGVLLLEGLVAISQPMHLPGAIQPYLIPFIAFLFPALLWVLIKPLLINQTKHQREHNELMAFKRDPNLFRALLQQQPQMLPIPDDLRPIILGNPDAEYTITMVTNPYCGPCSKMHEKVSNLVSKNRNIKVQIVFASCNEPTAKSVSTHLLSSYINGEDIAGAMNSWYKNKNYDSWLTQYGTNTIRYDFIKKHCDWVVDNNINITPTIFIDSMKLSNYSIEELGVMLKYFSDENQYLINNNIPKNEKINKLQA